MPKYFTNHFLLPKFTAPLSRTLMGILYNDTKIRDKKSQSIRGEKGESRCVAMMLKTGIKMANYYTVFNYGPLIPQKNIKSQDITIVAGKGNNLAPNLFSQVTAS